MRELKYVLDNSVLGMTNFTASCFWWWVNQSGFLQPEKKGSGCALLYRSLQFQLFSMPCKPKVLLSKLGISCLEKGREREQSDCQPINCKYEPLHLLSTILWYLTHYNGPCGSDHLVKQSSASITAHTRVHILDESTTSFVDLIWN
jgi:hypothetical protein